MFPDGDTSISVQVVMGFGECIDGDAKELALLLKALLSYSRSGGLAVLWILQPIRKMLTISLFKALGFKTYYCYV